MFKEKGSRKTTQGCKSPGETESPHISQQKAAQNNGTQNELHLHTHVTQFSHSTPWAPSSVPSALSQSFLRRFKKKSEKTGMVAWEAEAGGLPLGFRDKLGYTLRLWNKVFLKTISKQNTNKNRVENSLLDMLPMWHDNLPACSCSEVETETQFSNLNLKSSKPAICCLTPSIPELRRYRQSDL